MKVRLTMDLILGLIIGLGVIVGLGYLIAKTFNVDIFDDF